MPTAVNLRVGSTLVLKSSGSKVELQDLRFLHGDSEILYIPNFTLESGSQTVLTGASGCGKSTLIHILAGFLRPHSGHYLFDEKAVERLPERQWDALRAARLGVVVQHYPMLRGFHLLDNLLIPMGINGSVDREWAVDLLTRVGLQEHLYHLPAQLSAGQRQRAAIVRAVINKPDLVLADEPTAHLDPESGKTAMSLLGDLTQETGATLLVVTHDPQLRDRFSNHVELEALNRCAS